MRRQPQCLRNLTLEPERVDRCDSADHCDGGPQRERLVLQDESASGRPDEPADLPRRARERHVAPEQPRFRQVDDERRVDRAVQALSNREDRDRPAEQERGLRAGEPFPGSGDGGERSHPEQPHQREAAQAARSLDQLRDGKLCDGNDGGGDKPEDTNRGIAHVRSVLGERRQQLGHHRNAGADEDDVEHHVRDERAVSEHVGVASRLVVILADSYRGQQPQHDDEDQKRRRVQEKEERERPRVVGPRDRAGDEAAQRDAEVHRHALLCERRMATVLWRQRRQQRRLARPERAAACSDEHVEHERMPRRADEREQGEAEGHDHQRSGENRARAEPVRERAADEPRAQRGGGVRRDDQPCDAQRDPADVVQIDDQERPDDTVPEHVREAARLEDPDVAGQLRVQAAQVRPHRASLATRLGTRRRPAARCPRR